MLGRRGVGPSGSSVLGSFRGRGRGRRLIGCGAGYSWAVTEGIVEHVLYRVLVRQGGRRVLDGSCFRDGCTSPENPPKEKHTRHAGVIRSGDGRDWLILILRWTDDLRQRTRPARPPFHQQRSNSIERARRLLSALMFYAVHGRACSTTITTTTTRRSCVRRPHTHRKGHPTQHIFCRQGREAIRALGCSVFWAASVLSIRRSKRVVFPSISLVLGRSRRRVDGRAGPKRGIRVL